MVPKTEVSGTINGQPFSLVSPKDSTLNGLLVEVINHDQFGGTNVTRIKVESLTAVMNPDVITASGKVWTDSMIIVKDAVLEGGAKAASGGVK